MTASLGSEELLRRMKKALALPFSTHEFDDVVADLKAGKLQAFWNDDAIILTEICVSPRRRFLNIFLAAGSLEGVFALQPQIGLFGKNNGLTEAQGTMRPGWAPVLKKRGWKKWAEVWHLPIDQWNGNG